MPNVIDYGWMLLMAAILVSLAGAIIRTTAALHILQLEGYKSGRFLRWLINNPKRLIDVKEGMAMGCLLVLGLIIAFLKLRTLVLPLFLLAWIAIEAYFIVRRKRIKAKKPLVYTARARRLLGLSIALLAAAVIGVMLLSGGLSLWRLTGDQLYSQFLILCALTFWLNQLAAISLTAANVIIYPLEETIKACYLRSAKNKIRKLHPKVIAITGSYGKTSTKHILNTILSQKFKVLMTPESYNTPMGICKVIRGQLEPAYQIFIVEMGAYKRGDIRDLCKLVSPEIGILTAIGPQHLERFKSIDNIARAKYELVESLPGNGIAVFNDDDKICSGLADKTKIKAVRYSLDRLDDKVELTARDIQNTSQGLTLAVEKHSGEAAQIETRLLGKNNVYNILAAAAVALECGLSLDEISRAAKRLEPIPHRLQLIPGAGGVTVIDDGFNANPLGARAALEVLESFNHDQGRKVLVTPGMIELGDREFEQNKIFGAEAARVCDFVILVGPVRTKPILEGLREAGFPKEKTIVVESLAEATKRLKNLLKAGDVVLFENDLPDTYSEDV
ncbi:MAG: UDP-N-acetylmuramoyl-tripeptide--D-alanyl-D-alanine ligase [bacterium]